MARTILTDAAVRRMRLPVTGRVEVWDAALPGFGVRITENGRRSWVLLTRVHGRSIRLTWPWPATSLSDARKHARKAIDQAVCGEDPRAAKRRPARGPLAFERIATEFVEKWSKKRKRTWDEDERIFAKYVTPRWQGRRLDDITRADVVELGDAIDEENGPIMANRTLALVKKLFAWGLDRGLIDVHPAARLKGPGEETSRDRVLTDAELRTLCKAWDKAMGYPWGAALKLLALTGARRGEVEGMRWDEIDLDAKLWTIPKERVKIKVPFIVPLSVPALDLLSRVPRIDGCPYVFTTRGKGPIRNWSDAVADATEQCGFNGWRIHDLRRTVRTGLSRLGVPSDIAERVLGHVMPGVRGVYDRHDYLAAKRDALERWAAHVTALVAKADAAT